MRSPKIPENEIFLKLKKKNKKLGLAESCTGGMVSGRITNVPGISAYFNGSVIAYSNEVKVSVLGVPPEKIKKYGAVSRQVASLMAEGARRVLKTDIAAAVTGIAGPSGSTPGKPVGVAYIAVSSDRSRKTKRVLFRGDRLSIRSGFCDAVLGMILDNL
ncbi:MAG: CinA family protein [Candidatus Omnitrophota bacterium]